MGGSPVTRRMAGLTLAGIAGLAVLGAVILRSGLRRMAEEDVPYAMKYILVSLHMYAEANGGFFPAPSGAAGLARLLGTGVISWRNRDCLQHPNSRVHIAPGTPLTEAEVGYFYLGGHRRAESPETVILIEKNRDSSDDGCVGYLDGRALRVRGQDWQRVRRLMPDSDQ